MTHTHILYMFVIFNNVISHKSCWTPRFAETAPQISGGGWSRSRSRRCCRGIRWDSPNFRGFEQQIWGYNRRNHRRYRECTLYNQENPRNMLKMGLALKNIEQLDMKEMDAGLNPLAKHHVFYETERNGNLRSCALFSDTPWIGKLGMSPELWGYLIQEWENWPIENWGASDWEWRCSSKEMEIWPSSFGTLKSTDIDWGLTGRTLQPARLAWPVGCVAKRSSGEAGRLQDRNIME